MLMRRITRPISARRVDLDHHKLVGRKGRTHEVDNLARSVPAAAQTTDNVVGVIKWGDKVSSEGTRHSAISQAISAVNSTLLPRDK